MHGEVLVEVLVAGLRPGRRKFDERQTDDRTEAVFEVGRRLRVGKQVVLAAAGRATAQHLGDREFDAVADELGADYFCLGRPDVLVQPGHERPVVREPAHERHRVVRVRVDEARYQRMLPQVYAFRVRIFAAACGDRQDFDDRVGGQRDGMVFENHAMRFDRDDPARFEQLIDVSHSSRLLDQKRGTRITRMKSEERGSMRI